MNLKEFEYIGDTPIYRSKQTFKVDEGTLIQYNMYFFHNWNEFKFKRPYSRFIKMLLNETMYSKYVVDDQILNKYPIDGTNVSFLNFISTNYSAFSFIVNYLNIKILEGLKIGKKIASRQLDFDAKGQKNWVKEMGNVISLIKRQKNNLFKQGESVFVKMYKKIEETTSDGFRSEERMRAFIQEIKPNAYNIRSGSVQQDILKGIDILFDYNGKTYSVQQKMVESVTLKNNIYTINKITNNKNYNTNYIGYETKSGKLYLFKNVGVNVLGTDISKIHNQYMIAYK